jgi:peptidoglycan/LPS O-acetylase OafA/YrhL
VPYAVRRIARIVPAYWVALAIVTAWLGLHEVTTATGLIRYFGFLQLYGNLKTVTGGISPAWTLCVEVTFYVTLPLMAIAVRRAPRRWSRVSPELVLCGGLVALSLVWQAIICTRMPANSTWKLPLLWMLPGSLDLFAAGMALAVLSVAMQRREQAPGWLQIVQRQPWLPWLLAGAVFYVMGRTPSLSKHSFTAWWMTSHELKALGCGLLLAPLVIGDQGRGWLRRLLAWRPLIWLGSISYGIYLWHKPLLEKLAPHLLHHGQLFTDVALTAVTVAAAAASFYLVEQPAQRFARRLIAGRSVPVAPVLVGPVVASVPEDSAA